MSHFCGEMEGRDDMAAFPCGLDAVGSLEVPLDGEHHTVHFCAEHLRLTLAKLKGEHVEPRERS